jgi:hypothetical protein
VQGSPARTLVSWRLRSEEKRDPWFFFPISIRGFETLLRHASLLPRNRTCESSFTRYMGSVHFPAYPGSLSLSLSLSLLSLAWQKSLEKCSASPTARSSSPTPVSNTLPRIHHSVQYRGWSQAGQILGTEAQLANSPEPRSVAAQRCGVFLAFLTTSDREASRVLIFREREKSQYRMPWLLDGFHRFCAWHIPSDGPSRGSVRYVSRDICVKTKI